jgi:ubiquitin carboxyl-terminal hydrolase 16
LVRELHRKELDGAEVFDRVPQEGDGQKIGKPERIRQLQQGQITRAVKDMLDAMNERPIYRKTTTARPLIEALEKAYRTRISRSQQDAQEFLQVVAERLCDGYRAAVTARKQADSFQRDTLEESENDTRYGERKEAGGFVFGAGLFFEDVCRTSSTFDVK